MDTEDEWINRLPSWVVALVAVVFSAFMLWAFGGGYLQRRARNTNPRYTIGYVTGTSYAVGPSSHSVAFFTYAVGDSTYRSSSEGDLAAGCSRYLVKYAAGDPHNIEFYNLVCMPDSITSVPPQGWSAPPFAVPTSVE